MARETRIEEVLAGAARLFARGGFDGTSMRAVAAATDLSKPGLYYHFADKDALLFRLCHDAIARVLAGAEAAVAAADGPAARLRAVIGVHFAYFLDHPDALVVLNRERRRLSPDRQAEIGRLERRYLDLIRTVLRGGRDGGAFRRLNPTVAAFTVLSVLNGLDTWYRADGPLPPAEVEAQIAAILTRGLAAATGDAP